jgi:two-component system phosphate regulon response regulator PhoB
MTEPGTIILTSPRPDLAAALSDHHIGLRLVTIAQQPPAARIEGRIWCFVDWLLPNISGLEMCRTLRDAPVFAHSHITMVLDEDDHEARRRALRAGADDYLVGPLTPEALLGRLQQYRPSSISANTATRLAHGDLTADISTQQARWQGKPVPMSPNEFHLLAHFIEHPDQVFSRSSLIELLGKQSEAIDERTVDVWVGRLRRALKAHGAPDPLRTVRSMGYVLDGIYETPFKPA